MRVHPALRATVALAMTLAATILGVAVTATAAYADACYTWGRQLSQGMSGDDVRQLQLRVAGWSGYHDFVAVDGSYGTETANAVKRFQSAYGLTVDGIAGSQTFNKLYALQDDDCTPIHFSYNEMDDVCYGGWTGGPLSASATKANALRTMWKLEALRHALGDHPLTVGGFRSYACNNAVGGASNSQHLYGLAADITSSSSTLCQIAKEARYHGFSGILGPGYPDHNDHVHADSRAENNDDGVTNSWSWSAPNCGI
ncbi:MAG TPA: D-Ala-D-Ala carboxypeptidase family metallohydrolase [Micromonosporaceae bacterium]